MELATARDGLVVGEERSDGNGGAALGHWWVGWHRRTEAPSGSPFEAWGIPGGSLGRACPPD